jgi:galactonate dehydratase
MFNMAAIFGYAGAEMRAISAIDIALWDICGQALGVPIYDLLGGPVRENVPLYTHAPGAEGGAMARSNVTKELSIEVAVDAVKQGYSAIKTDPFSRGWLGDRATGGDIVEPLSPRLINEAADWMISLRSAVGPDVELMVDAHARFDVASAIRAARALEPANLLWIEEPIPNESVQALKQFRENTNIPLCVGERHFTRWDYMPLLEAGVVDYIMPDVCWTGGISELRRIAAVAEPYYVRFSPHDTNGPVVVMASAHVDISAPNLYRQEVVHEFLPHYAKIPKKMFEVREGSMYLDASAPGLGIELDHEKMEQWVVYSPGERRDKPFRFFIKELSSGGGVAPGARSKA